MSNINKSYNVIMKVRGYYCNNFTANSKKEAEEYALNSFYEADFGELGNVDMTLCEIEKSIDNDGTYDMTAVIVGVYEKEVIANSEEQASEIASTLFCEADFGELDDSDIEDIIDIE